MVKTITKIGNSQGVMFDAALMELAHLKAGDEVNVEVHEGGTITLTPELRAKIYRYYREYGQGGWQNKVKRVFRREMPHLFS